MEEEGEGMRARSFRDEDYSNRRVFLRSYPLRWGDDDAEDGREEHGDEGRLRGGGGGDHKGWVAPLKRRMAVAVFRWRGDTVVLVRKIKNKVAFYLLFACRPFGFKPPHHPPPSPGC